MAFGRAILIGDAAFVPRPNAGESRGGQCALPGAGAPGTGAGIDDAQALLQASPVREDISMIQWAYERRRPHERPAQHCEAACNAMKHRITCGQRVPGGARLERLC